MLLAKEKLRLMPRINYAQQQHQASCILAANSSESWLQIFHHDFLADNKRNKRQRTKAFQGYSQYSTRNFMLHLFWNLAQKMVLFEPYRSELSQG